MSGQGNLKVDLESLQQKAKERTVKTQNIEYDLETLVQRIKKGSIKLDPDYQRRHRWPNDTSSRLIESLILNIPIPVIFISQDVDVDDEVEESVARYTVIDGQQRLTAIFEFMTGRLHLSGLETLEELNGSCFRDLPPFLTRRLEERTIRCLRIDSTADSQVKFDIFERLNTGSVKLEAQELRNATARGRFNDAIKDMATNNYFRKLIQVDISSPLDSVKVQKMEDAELVLRFFSLREGGYNRLRKGFRDFLTENLISMNKMKIEDVNDYVNLFSKYMEFILETCGDKAFAKYRFEGGDKKRMSTFNAAVFDAVAVGISDVFSVDDIMNRQEQVADRVRGYEILFSDADFFSAVSGSVNDAAKVKTRIDAMIGFLKR
ncbi:GmrSD restriction endonuclease domain-containing protein [Thalassospira xiamenensis]|uniref:GmrSD restriction endonuclease domain-containing protein n=1 Tax=Thalassospira xiamenensis TaxID=220697 RepID=UPI001FFEDF21|nr:DUF262 domain-containing protein [Thalassospira xiamenensis]MCK2168822.1 DUF262 domain-containing protein [Thalassospira xiamenensis]